MYIYRPHRGSLADALAEAQEFENEQAMKEFIYNEHKKYCMSLGFPDAPFEIEDIVIGVDSTDDPRCGWHDSRYVCVKRYGNEDYMKEYGSPQCIGMCATDYERG